MLDVNLTKHRKAEELRLTPHTESWKVRVGMSGDGNGDKSLESWIWNAACSIRGAKDAPKYKDYILPLIFTKRLCDVFDDELNRISKEVVSRAKAFKLVKHDKKLIRRRRTRPLSQRGRLPRPQS